MSLLIGIELTALVLSAFTLVVLFYRWSLYPFSNDLKISLMLIIGVGFCIHLGNFLEWAGITAALDPIEDYLDLAYPILWGGVFYAFLHSWLNQRLGQDKDRLQQYMDAVGVAIVILDNKEKISFINPEGRKFLGMREDDILGKNFYQSFVFEDDRERLQDLYHGILNGRVQQVARGEARIIAQEGLRLVSWTATLLEGGLGQPPSVLCSATDMTASRQLETALSTIKAHERALIDNLPFLAWVKDPLGRFILVNRNFAKACGKDIRSIIGRTDLDVWPQPLAENYRADDESVMQTRLPKFVEEPINLPDGQRWFETCKSPIIDLTGKLIGTTGVARDITERRQASEALRKSEEKLRSIFAAAPVGLGVIVDRVFVDVNERVCEMTGYAREELIGQGVRKIYPSQEDYELVGRVKYAMLKDKGLGQVETRWQRKDGAVIDVVLSSTFIDPSDWSRGVTFSVLDITSRKKSDALIFEKTEELEKFFNCAIDLLCITDTDGFFHRLNPQWEKVLHYQVRELVGKSLFDFIHPDDLSSTRSAMQELLKEREVVNFINRFRCRDGTYRWLEWRSFPIGKKIYAAAHDITDYLQKEKELKEGEAKLRQVIDLVPHFIFAKNRQGQFIIVNKAVADTYGTTVENLMGKTDADFDKNPREVEHFLNDDLDVMDRGVPKDIPEELITDSQGQKHFLHTVKIPFKVAATGDQAVLGVSTDITERKVMMQAVQESEEKYRSLVEAACDAIFVADAQSGIILDVNHAAEELIGLPREQIIGLHQTELHPKGEAQHYRDMFERYVRQAAQGRQSDVGFVFNHKTGRIPVQISIAIVDIHNHKFLMGIFRDITELKLIEEALRQDKQNLQTIVNEQTEDLRKSMKQLEDARRLSDIGALAATVAHELRNPLGVIKTAIYNVRRKAENPDLDRHLDNVEKKIAESERIIKNLLTYAQIKTPKYSAVNIVDVLNECVENCRQRYSAMQVDIAIRQRAGKHAPVVRADSLHLNQIFANVLENAYQSFLEPCGRIDIELDFDEKKDFVHVRIADNGVGIEKEILPKIFDPFFTTRARGTGLGLSVCNQIVNLYDGRIDVKSVKGKGTTVTVTLPVQAGKTEHDASGDNPSRG